MTKLSKKLDDQRAGLTKVDNYYEGVHPLGFATPKFREAFGALFTQFADNWCDLVVDAAEERLHVQGFRFDTPEADTEAWRIWQANNLDAEHRIGHTESLVHGRAYATVWGNDDDEDTPVITIEHPKQMIVAVAAGNRRRRLAALKRFTDDDGYQRATLYLPDSVHRFRQKRRSDSGLIVVGDPWGGMQWEPLATRDQDSVIDNPLGVVPVVPLVNRRRLLNDGVSELARVIPIQDGVNKLVADMLVASEFGAAPQRWATGIEIPRDPQTGQPIKAFENLVSRIWASEKSETQFGQFQQTDLRPFVEGIEMLVQHIASQTRTPPHYFYLKGQFPSGESIKSAETGLVAKVIRKQGHFGEAWEEVMRLAFMVKGDDARASVVAETLWGDPESRSESEHVDAVMKQKALGIPDEALWEELGKTPQQISRYKALIAEAARAPKATSPDEMSFGERVETLANYVRAGFDPIAAAKELGLPAVPHTGRLPVTVQGDKSGGAPAPAPLPE